MVCPHHMLEDPGPLNCACSPVLLRSLCCSRPLLTLLQYLPGTPGRPWQVPSAPTLRCIPPSSPAVLIFVLESESDSRQPNFSPLPTPVPTLVVPCRAVHSLPIAQRRLLYPHPRHHFFKPSPDASSDSGAKLSHPSSGQDRPDRQSQTTRLQDPTAIQRGTEIVSSESSSAPIKLTGSNPATVPSPRPASMVHMTPLDHPQR